MLVKYIPGLMLREALSNRNIGFLVAAALGGLRMTDASPKVHSWLGGRVRAQGTWRPCSGMELGPSWEDNKDNTTRIWQRRKTEEDGAVEGSPTTPRGSAHGRKEDSVRRAEGLSLPADRAHGRLILGDQGGERPEGPSAGEQRKRGMCVQWGVIRPLKRRNSCPLQPQGWPVE